MDISANDYTIIVKNIPLDFEAIEDDYDEDLKLFLEKNGLEDRQVKFYMKKGKKLYFTRIFFSFYSYYTLINIIIHIIFFNNNLLTIL